MKKVLITIFCLCMPLAFCACGDGTHSSTATDNSSSYAVSSEDVLSSTEISEESAESAESIESIESIESEESAETSEESSSTESVETYTVTYVGIKNYNKSVIEIPQEMMPASKSYPTQYAVGAPVVIDGLQYAYTTLAEYEFLGYYTNAECTDPFTGITETTTGEITIYALIQVNYNTPNV